MFSFSLGSNNSSNTRNSKLITSFPRAKMGVSLYKVRLIWRERPFISLLVTIFAILEKVCQRKGEKT